MKRTNLKRIEHHRRQATYVLRRKWAGKWPPPKRRIQASAKKRQTYTIRAPEVFSLVDENYRKEMMDFISRLDTLIQRDVRIAIDFSNTQTLHPCGTLLFMSHLDGAEPVHTAKISCNYPSNNVVGQLFQHVGILSRLGLSKRWEITSDMVKHWHYSHGICTDMSGLKKLMSDYEQSLSGEVRSQLFASLSEAITNVINHAYPMSKDQSDKKQWWMFSQRTGGNLFIAVCDHGIGIPGSLRSKPYLRDHLRRLMMISRKRMDETLISDAVGSPRTVTQLPYRGKGLPEMLAFVKLLGQGRLTILSQHGAFSYNGETNRKASVTYHRPINGTLIFWEIPLEGSQGG